jgi:2,4-dienoyl-CoA reductase-like NADH-dependent reductase (Old Yellow Enzyme family)
LKNSIDRPFVFPRTGKVAKNRSVLAAMTNKQSHSNGTISSTELKWLVRRAKGGFGIITTAATHVSKDGQGWDGEIGLFSDDHIEKLKILLLKSENMIALVLLNYFTVVNALLKK